MNRCVVSTSTVKKSILQYEKGKMWGTIGKKGGENVIR